MAPLKFLLARMLVLASGLAAMLMPFAVDANRGAHGVGAGFPGWPSTYEGRTLTELPISSREQAFARDFPGRIGRFSDGNREIILRWLSAPTRRLHPASDCFRGLGYAIKPLPLRKDASGNPMGCFRATRGKEQSTVCESLSDAAGQTFSDASAWYWTAMLGHSTGPWWSVVVAQ